MTLFSTSINTTKLYQVVEQIQQKRSTERIAAKQSTSTGISREDLIQLSAYKKLPPPIFQNTTTSVINKLSPKRFHTNFTEYGTSANWGRGSGIFVEVTDESTSLRFSIM